MKTNFIKDSLLWGFLLWLTEYILGLILFMIVPVNVIGWIITPLGIALTIWVLMKKINNISLNQYIIIGITWSLMAVVLDYFLIVKAFNPADGYYKTDVYLYYLLTLLLPPAAGWWKKNRKR